MLKKFCPHIRITESSNLIFFSFLFQWFEIINIFRLNKTSFNNNTIFYVFSDDILEAKEPTKQLPLRRSATEGAIDESESPSKKRKMQ